MGSPAVPSAADSDAFPASHRHFELNGGKTLVECGVPLAEYVSSRSGLRVFIGAVTRPQVDVTFFIRTQLGDNSGCARALSRLLLRGSVKYPHQRFLEVASARALAWEPQLSTTATQTTVTFTALCPEAVKVLLPVYVDHILHPLLSDEAFAIEIHYIAADGTDGGHMLEEVKELESDALTITERKLHEMAYPASCGSHYDPHGRLEDFLGLKISDVRAFHQDFYHLGNIAIVVVGLISACELLDTIAECEAAECAPKSTPFPKTGPLPDQRLTGSPQRISVPFPSSRDNLKTAQGAVAWGWQQPYRPSDIEERVIAKVLGLLLAQRCNEVVLEAHGGYSLASVANAEFESVPGQLPWCFLAAQELSPELLAEIHSALQSAIKTESETGVDTEEVMRHALYSYEKNVGRLEEASPDIVNSIVSDYFVDCLSADFATLEKYWRASFTALRQLCEQPKSRDLWTDKFNRFYRDASSTQVLAFPDCDMAEQWGMKAARRAAAELRRLVSLPGGVEEWQRRLDEMQSQFDKRPPDQLLETIPLIKAATYNPARYWFSTNLDGGVFESSPIEKYLPADPKRGLAVLICDAPTSNFFHLRMVTQPPLDTLTAEELSVLPIFADLVEGNPVSIQHLSRSKELLAKYYHNDLSEGLKTERLMSGLDWFKLCDEELKYCYVFHSFDFDANEARLPNIFGITVSCLVNRLESLLLVLLTMLDGQHFSPEAIKANANQVVLNVGWHCGEYSRTAMTCTNAIWFDRKSLRVTSSAIHALKIATQIRADPAHWTPIVTSLWHKTFGDRGAPAALMLAGPLDALGDHRENLSLVINRLAYRGIPSSLPDRCEYFRKPESPDLGRGVVFLNDLDSASFIDFTIACDIAETSTEFALLTILSEMIASLEGPLCNALWGPKSTSQVKLKHCTWTRRLSLRITTGDFSTQAFADVINSIEALVEGQYNEEIAQYFLDDRMGCLSQIHKDEEGADAFAYAKFYSAFYRRPRDYSERLFHQMQEATAAGVIGVAKRILAGFLSFDAKNDTGKSLVFSVPSKQGMRVSADLKSCGRIKNVDSFRVMSWDAMRCWLETGTCDMVEIGEAGEQQPSKDLKLSDTFIESTMCTCTVP